MFDPDLRSGATVSMAALTLQSALFPIMVHFSGQSPEAGVHFARTVLLIEVIKGVLLFGVAVRKDLQSEEIPSSLGKQGVAPEEVKFAELKRAATKVTKDLFNLGDSWRLVVPACLIVLQANLRFIGAENLDVPTFQITSNLEILTTALFSVALLNRRLTRRKWAALFLLAAGVGVLHGPSFGALTELEMAYGPSRTRVRGFVAVALSCCASALAGAILEPVFSANKVDPVVQNFRIFIFGLVPAFLLAMFPSFNLLGPPSPAPQTANPSLTAWILIITQAVGSVVSCLSRRDVAVLNRDFASSLAFPISLIAGWSFGFQVTPQFLAGSLWIILATYLHNSCLRHPNATLRAPPLPHHTFDPYRLESSRTSRPPPSIYGPTPPSPPRRASSPPPPRRATLCEPRTSPALVGAETSPYDEGCSSFIAVHSIVRSPSMSSMSSSMSSPSLLSEDQAASEMSWVPLASPSSLAGGFDDVQRMV